MRTHPVIWSDNPATTCVDVHGEVRAIPSPAVMKSLSAIHGIQGAPQGGDRYNAPVCTNESADGGRPVFLSNRTAAFAGMSRTCLRRQFPPSGCDSSLYGEVVNPSLRRPATARPAQDGCRWSAPDGSNRERRSGRLRPMPEGS